MFHCPIQERIVRVLEATGYLISSKLFAGLYTEDQEKNTDKK